MRDEFLRIAIQGAFAAGANVRAQIGGLVQVSHKGEIDLVTEVDRDNEAMLHDLLGSRYPHIRFYGEEGTITGPFDRDCWIVDPLDGTTNFAHGYPHVAISIALFLDGTVRLGVVYDPFLDELFYATPGGGAFLNRQSISVSRTVDLNNSLLSTGFPYNIREDPGPTLSLFGKIAIRCQGIRRDGAAALDLSYVAAGRVDGFWQSGLKPWDTAAGKLIILEAGGHITDFSDNPHELDSLNIIASNGNIHGELLDIVKEVLET